MYEASGLPCCGPCTSLSKDGEEGRPRGWEKRTPGEGKWGHAREPQSCHRPLMLRLLNAAAPHHFCTLPRSEPGPSCLTTPGRMRFSEGASRVSAQGQVYTWVLPHTIMRTFPFLDTLLLPHPLHNPLDLQSARNHGTTLFHQGLG